MGTDHHFVKTTDNHFIYTLVIQTDKSGGSCVMEMGVHLDFLPNSIGEFKSLNEITTYDCEFRKRLDKKSISLAEIIARSKKIEDFGAPLDLRLVLLIARTHKFLGNDRDAKEYAQWGLINIGKATGLIKDFEAIGRGSL